MGTSNWQNIPFCVEALMKIAPQRVLDVGVGYGRWGMIVREFCDVWYGRIFQPDWSVHLEGIEGFKKNISDYHRSFYNQIHLGDAREIIFTLKGQWNVVILGDVLEHFERQIGESILNWCLDHSDYIIVNIPMGSDWSQTDIYENAFERHLSVWNEQDFDQFALCRKSLFLDYIGRPFGSFVLSRLDPKALQDTLFSVYTKGSEQAAAALGEFSAMTHLYTQAVEMRNEQLLAEINALRNSRSYRLIERMKTTPIAGLLARLVKTAIPAEISPSGNGSTSTRGQSPIPVSLPPRNEADRQWAEQQSKNPRPLSINNPEWRGIWSSANELFGNLFPVPDDLNEERALYYAELFKDAGVPSVTIQGFPISYFHLVNAIRRVSPQMPIYAIWHGNFLHSKEDYAWKSFTLLTSFYNEGAIRRIGYVKKGMAEVMSASGIRSSFVMNLVRQVPKAPSTPLAGANHIGIWAEPDWGWKKLPYAMLASLSLIPNAFGHVRNVSLRAQELGEILKIKADYYPDPLPSEQMLEELAKMHVNLYVSLTECAPMLPLESLSVGAPCLFGPTSHYFLDHDYLHQRLVVASPDNPETVAQMACQALQERGQIIAAYQAYAPEYNRQALQTLSDFLEFSTGDA